MHSQNRNGGFLEDVTVYVHPQSVPEVQRLVLEVRYMGMNVACVGSGHSGTPIFFNKVRCIGHSSP